MLLFVFIKLDIFFCTAFTKLYRSVYAPTEEDQNTSSALNKKAARWVELTGPSLSHIYSPTKTTAMSHIWQVNTAVALNIPSTPEQTEIYQPSVYSSLILQPGHKMQLTVIQYLQPSLGKIILFWLWYKF